MSRWTHIIGSFYIETNVETDNLKSYIEDQLKFAPKITGSEKDVDIFVNPLSGHNTFVSPDCKSCKYKETLKRMVSLNLPREPSFSQGQVVPSFTSSTISLCTFSLF